MKTRNQRIDEYFNGVDWSISDDISLMGLLRYRAAPHLSLSATKVFDEVIREVHTELECLRPNEKTLLDVKLRIRALASRFWDFKEFIGEPGVHFNHQTLQVSIDPTQRTPRHVGQTREAYKVILYDRNFSVFVTLV